MQEIINTYQNWLHTLNYSKATVKNNPHFVAEFFAWTKVETLEEVNNEMIQKWFDHLSTRKHQRKEGSITLNYIKGYRNALSQFARFLRETGRSSFEVKVTLKSSQKQERQILTLKEISELYEATANYPDPMIKDKGLLASRERAILGLYYGCGLRKNEGLQVEIKDLDFKKGLLYVRKGKNYKERYVPIPQKVQSDFIHYIGYARPLLLRKQHHEKLLTGWYGSPLKGSALLERLQLLASIAGIEKTVGLHTLRHSIATHLLQSGMKLEQIARFLGHSSLESTQIYTHLANEAL